MNPIVIIVVLTLFILVLIQIILYLKRKLESFSKLINLYHEDLELKKRELLCAIDYIKNASKTSEKQEEFIRVLENDIEHLKSNIRSWKNDMIDNDN